MANPYQVLGVARDADQDTIKREYKRLARMYHPDRNSDPDAVDRFKSINAAYDVLGDAEKRSMWDEFGDMAFQPGFDAAQARYWGNGGGGRSAGRSAYDHGAGYSMDDILGTLFGHDARARGGARRGEHQTIAVDVDPMLAIRGGETVVEVRRPTGRTDRLKVRVPAGAKDGGKLRLKGQGLAPAGGGPCGDLLIRLKVADHEALTRDGDDLELTVPITVLEAIRGARIDVPTPTGTVKVSVPAGAVAGQRLRLKGRGVQRPTRPGDLWVVLQPTVPTSTEAEVIAAAEKLEAAYNGSVRKELGKLFES